MKIHGVVTAVTLSCVQYAFKIYFLPESGLEQLLLDFLNSLFL